MDIKKQTGKNIFIYLSNGYQNIFWNHIHESPRKVMGFHTQEDLEQIRFQNSAKENLLDIKIKEEITNTPYQIEAIKQVVENIKRGKRKSLIVMATDCGKTRTASNSEVNSRKALSRCILSIDQFYKEMSFIRIYKLKNKS